MPGPPTQSGLQDNFLHAVRRENIGVVIYLSGGAQLRGNVTAFDNFTILLESNGKAQLVYKHAITNITPVRNPHLQSAPREHRERREPKPLESSGGEA